MIMRMKNSGSMHVQNESISNLKLQIKGEKKSDVIVL